MFRPTLNAVVWKLLVGTVVTLFALGGCKSPDEGSDSTGGGSSSGGGSPGGPITGLQLDIPAQPLVTWKDVNGKTTVVVQFSARDDAGAPLTEDDLDVQMLIDDRPLDNESLLDKSSKELEVNLYYGMVLDASYSMTQHTPPAFEPMKKAARDNLQEVLDIWSQRPGDVKFSVMWFDEVMNQSVTAAGTDRSWQSNDILSIPDPIPGKATKLFSSVQSMTTFLRNEYDNNVFNGPRDQHVMLVFSDGADNYSWFDNSSVDSLMTTSTGAAYHLFGTPATTLDKVKEYIGGHPSLTVHVIGLGSAINDAELQAIADAGQGTFQKNPSSENLDELFNRVLKEFTTLQTRGAEIPLPPGDYQFTLHVRAKNGDAQAEHRFSFHAGDAGAGVIN